MKKTEPVTEPVTVAELIKFLKKLPKDFKILSWRPTTYHNKDGFFYSDFKLPDIDDLEFLSVKRDAMPALYSRWENVHKRIDDPDSKEKKDYFTL